jgi:phage tail-like protein
MPDRSVLFPAHSFLVVVKDAHGAETVLGGFVEATNLPRKVHGVHKAGDVTLKRGIVSSQALWNWLEAGAGGRRDFVLIQRGEAGIPLASWRLNRGLPVKYTGPTLSGKGSDVAIEELVLSFEGIEWIPPK